MPDGASSRRPMVCCPAQQPSGDDPGAKNPATTALWMGRDLLPEIARRGPGRGGWVGSEGAEVTSAVDVKLEAREPDL